MYLGIRELPRDISAFELQSFFTFSPAELKLIEARRGAALKLGLALHIGFLRMCGRLLNAFRVVPPLLWSHLGTQFGVDAPPDCVTAGNVRARSHIIRSSAGSL